MARDPNIMATSWKNSLIRSFLFFVLSKSLSLHYRFHPSVTNFTAFADYRMYGCKMG